MKAVLVTLRLNIFLFKVSLARYLRILVIVYRLLMINTKVNDLISEYLVSRHVNHANDA